MKNRVIDSHIIHADTIVQPFKMGEICGIGFDVKKKSMLGIACEDWRVAKALGQHFISMSNHMKKNTKKEKI